VKGPVRVLRYRHVHPDRCTFDAYWLTSFSAKRLGPRALFHLCKSRWGIENHGFNDAKNRYGLKYIPHHEPNSIRVNTLLTFFAMRAERLYRIRFLRRGGRAPYTAIQLLRLLWLNIGQPTKAYDTSSPRLLPTFLSLHRRSPTPLALPSLLSFRGPPKGPLSPLPCPLCPPNTRNHLSRPH